VTEIFPGDLAAAPDFRDAVTAAYVTIAAEGARAAAARIAG